MRRTTAPRSLRSLWYWPVRSPKHLVVSLVVGAALVGGVSQLWSGGDHATASAPPAAPQDPADAIVVPSYTLTPMSTPDTPTSVPTTTPPRAPAVAPVSFTRAAESFARIWVTKSMPAPQWHRELAALSTDTYGQIVLPTIPGPTAVDATRVTGAATTLRHQGRGADVRINTDAGFLAVNMQDIDGHGSWRVNSVAPGR